MYYPKGKTKRLHREFGLAGGLGTLALCLCPIIANAASAEVASEISSISLEEITVTAQKRSENLQDTPIAITAFTAKGLENRGISNIQQVGDFTPNMTFDFTAPVSGVSSGAVVFIRGIGQSDFALTTDPGVGTYVDGVYMSRSVGGVLDVLDIERIEVLRGPQGTLFGRNTIGGAINIISLKPANEFGGKFELTGGSYKRMDLRASVDIPVSDKLLTHFAASSKNRDGYVKGLMDKRSLGDENRDSARATFLLMPSDNFSASLALDGTRIREQNAPATLVGITQGTSVALYNAYDAPITGIPYDDRWIPSDIDTTYATGPNGTHLDIWGAALTLDYNFDAFDVKSITAYRKTKGYFNRDADGSPAVVTHTENFHYQHEQFSQELQITGTAIDSRLKYAVGAYYFWESGDDFLTVPLAPAYGTLLNYTTVSNNSLAGYAQGTFDVTNDLSLTAGIRYTRDKKGYDPLQILTIGQGFADVLGLPLGTEIPVIPAVKESKVFTNWSPRLAVNYNFSDDLMAYASVTKGFKSGGFNIRYLAPRAAALPYDPEKVTAYEVGAKWEGLDRRLRLNAAAFYTDYKDIQVIVYEDGAPLNQNAGAAHIKGVELEATALPVPELQLSAGLGYIDAKYTELNPPTANIPLATQVTLDKELANTPEWSLNASAQYTVALSNAGSVVLRTDWSYTSHVQNDAQNSPFLYAPGHHMVNASIAYVSPDEQWQVKGFVNNITNKRYIVSGDSNYGLGFHQANYNRPREWGMTVQVNF